MKYMGRIRGEATKPAVYIFLLVLASILMSQSAPPQRVGPLPDGSFLLNSGWRLKPAGLQIPLDTLPMSCTMSRHGRFLFVLNGGYKPPSISVIELSENKVVSTVQAPKDAWLGLALAPDGKTLWVGGGSSASIHEFKYDGTGTLTLARTFPLVKPEQATPQDFIGDVAVSPDGRLLYAADIFHDSIVVVNAQSGAVIGHFKTGRRPYRILFHPDGKSFFVTSWADGTLHHHQASDGSSLQTIRVGAHPTDILWRDGAVGEETGIAARLFVPAANTNNVYSIGVSESKDLKPLETINIATTPRHPLGMTPSALAMSADAKTLYIVCSDANAVAVADITEERTHVTGFIPAGWYPTAAAALSDGRLIVLNGKGLRSFANPHGPQPMTTPEVPHKGGREGYVGYLQTGTASV
ncbi:MAG TPA: beta-propeller fold lactonase family protein, partial [Bryobacteraceae bacterium]|nr:beta-propeller fold lactonase family protein [Bryobacteraceae bacterium]